MAAASRITYAQWLGFTAVLVVVGLYIGWFAVDDEDQEVVAYLVFCAVNILVAAALLLRFAPASDRDAGPENKPARRGLVLGVLALVTVVAFWSGLPFSLGIPALALGLSGRARAAELGEGGVAAAAVALGAGAALIGLLSLIVG